jgi:LemA protein
MTLALPVCLGFVAVAVAFLAVFYVLSIYNGLVSLKNNIDKAWSNIDVLLKQRADLVPNLVETVKGYAKHEKAVFESVTKMRTEVLKAQGPADKARANDLLTSALKSVFAVAENYPKLKASDNFLELQKQIAAIENQVADRREFYNDSVLLYNTRIEVLPDSLFASIMGYKKKEYFRAEDAEKKPVKVEM